MARVSIWREVGRCPRFGYSFIKVMRMTFIQKNLG